MKRFMISLLAFVSFAGIYAQSPIFDVNGIYYRLFEDTIVNNTNGLIAAVTTMGETDHYKGSVTIPSTVSYNGVDYPVTAITDLAFKGCKQLTSISIPASVIQIPSGAFYGCSSLTSITVAASNTVYDSRDNCNAVIEIATNTLVAGCKTSTIPSSVLYIGECAFYGSSIASLEIPSNVLSIGGWAFLDCLDLTSVKISDGVASIGTGAFMGCNNITSLYIPSSITNAGISIFTDCNISELHWNRETVPSHFASNFPHITSVVLGDSVLRIDHKAFEGCNSLKSINIPSSIQYITPSAFSGCYSIETVFWDVKDSLDTMLESVIKFSTTTLKKLELGSHATFAGLNRTLSGFNNLVSITVDPDNKLYDSRNNCNAVIDSRTNKLVMGCSKTVIPNSVTEIGDYAFLNCNSLESIQFPSSLKIIGYEAFGGCGGLKAIDLPASLEYIGPRAFGGCSLSSVSIPKNVSYIGNDAFLHCYELTSIKVDQENTVYDSRNNCNAIIETQTDRLIVGCKNTTIPADISIIGSGAFRYCQGLTAIEIPSNVTAIEDYAFYWCADLTSINLPTNLRTLGSYAFSYCENLTSLTIPDGMTSIEQGLLMGCSSLVSIDIPSSVKNIGNYAFYDCSSLESVVIPEGVTDVSLLFDNCKSLSYLSLPYTAKIERNRTPFSGCPALKTAGPKGGGYNLEFSWDTIPGCAFNGMRSLKSIYIPKTVKLIDSQNIGYRYIAVPDGNGIMRDYYKTCYFEGCDSLESLAISFSDTKIMRRKSPESRYVFESPADFSLYIGTPIHLITILDDTIKTLNQIGIGVIDEVVVSKYVKEIKNGVFGQLKYVNNIEVESDNSGFSSLNGVLFNKDKSELLAYPVCRQGWYRVPLSTTTLNNKSFMNCNGLSNVTITKNVSIIGESAFEGCYFLKEVTIEGSPEIGLNAFSNCDNIQNIWTRSAVPGLMHIFDEPQTIVTGDYGSIANSSYLTVSSKYDDGLGREISEISPAGRSDWNCRILSSNIPAGKYKISIGILPNSLPNYIHPTIEVFTDRGSEVLYDSISIEEVDFNGWQFNLEVPYYFTNNTAGYDSVVIVDALDIPENTAVRITLQSGVIDDNMHLYSDQLLMDRIFFEPLNADIPVERYAGTFTQDVFNHATIYVPDGAIGTYKSTAGWELFKNYGLNTRYYPDDEVEVTISDAGYATFYYSTGDYALPEGLSAMVVSGISDDKLIYETIATGSDGGVVPAGVPVILASDNKQGGVFKLSLTYDSCRYEGNNLLIGSDVTTKTFAGSSSRFYKLAYGPSGTDMSDILGWYWGAADGGAFLIEAHKAWLALPAATTKGMIGFSLSGDATYVIDIDSDLGDETTVYDIYGRKLSAPTGSGMYIINGKKVIITK